MKYIYMNVNTEFVHIYIIVFLSILQMMVKWITFQRKISSIMTMYKGWKCLWKWLLISKQSKSFIIVKNKIVIVEEIAQND